MRLLSSLSPSSVVAVVASPLSMARVRRLHPNLWWAAGGWIFFVAENALLSENRTAIIAYLNDNNNDKDDDGHAQQDERSGAIKAGSVATREEGVIVGASSVGEDRYHLLYGIASTIATASIGYSYYRLRRAPGSGTLTVNTILPISRAAAGVGATAAVVAAWACLSGGWVLAMQALPKMQLPVSTKTWQVRCPFDFTDRRNREGGAAADAGPVRGTERITRHPGLWSLALVGAGQAILSRPHPVAYWWWGPSAVALLGGWHHDSRFRRGIGGQFDPFYESQTSNVPLAAVLSGKQGPVLEALREVAGQDIKPLNAALGVAIASAWVYAASRGRVKLK